MFLRQKRALCLLEVQREERDDGHPQLVAFRSEVQANECCTPRELNALEAHMSFFLKMSASAFVQIGWVSLSGTRVIAQVAGREPGICKGVLCWGLGEDRYWSTPALHGTNWLGRVLRRHWSLAATAAPAAMASGVCGFGAA